MKRSIGQSLVVEGFAWTLATLLARACKMSFIVGSYHATFSGVNVLMPLAGAFNSLFGTTLIVGLQATRLFLTGGSGNLHFLAYFVPGLFAALYWQIPTHWYARLVAISSMALFAVHPVGRYALPYTALWLFPLIASFYASRSFFVHALSSTLIAHAVGSVIWLYTMQLTPALWLSLTPISCIERLFFALAITLAYHGVQWVHQRIKLLNPVFA